MGCQDLLDDVPGRSRGGKDGGGGGSGSGSGAAGISSPGDGSSGKHWYRLKPSSSKSYSIKDETSSKCHPIRTYSFKHHTTGCVCIRELEVVCMNPDFYTHGTLRIRNRPEQK